MLKCKETRGYALTEGSEYEKIKAERDFVFLVNDAGNTVRYKADMFDEVNVQPAIVPRPVAPPPPPARTEQDCINSIRVTDAQATYTHMNGANKVIRFNYVNGESPISCGITNITGINDTIASIDISVESENHGDDLIALRKALFSKMTLGYLENNTRNSEILLMSTNIDDEDYMSVLDNISHFTSDEVRNPNSGNQIKMWGFYKSRL